MILQLPFFLDVSSNKHVCSWDHGFEKNFLNLMRHWGENCKYELVNNFLNLIRKRGRKLEDLINKKSLKLDKKTKKKINYLLLCVFAYREWTTPKT